ncbi:MAG: HDOD domain-containing protein [Planctomycetes bacterium]|nr:HDOD domain-containing protein [Planctomycetota bacterium]
MNWFRSASDHELAPTGTDSAVPLPVELAPPNTDKPAPHLRLVEPPTGDTAGGEWWIPRGEPVLVAPPRSADEAVDAELHGRLCGVLDSPDLELPHLPRVAARVLESINSDNVNYRSLAETVEQDPVLAAEVLRVANSAMFRGIREIATLEQAFSRIGLRELRSLVFARHTKGLAIRTGGPEKSLGEELWQRAVAAAVVASQFAKRARVPERDAFLIGLLHYIGSLVLLRVTHDYQKTHGCRVRRSLFDRLDEQWHERLGLRLADAWHLPDPLPMLIGAHHGPIEPDDPLRRPRLLIEVADACRSMLGYAPYVPYDFFKLPGLREWELTDNEPTRKLLADLPQQIVQRLQSTL